MVSDDEELDTQNAVEDAEAAPDATPEEAMDPLTAAEARIVELEDRLRRQEAEFVNETRRIRRQSQEQGKYRRRTRGGGPTSCAGCAATAPRRA